MAAVGCDMSRKRLFQTIYGLLGWIAVVGNAAVGYGIGKGSSVGNGVVVLNM